MSRLPRWLLLLAAAAAGAFTGLGFQPTDWWPLTIVGVAALSLLSRGMTGRVALLLGYVYGAGFGVVALSWISVLGSYVAVLLIAVVAAWWALLGWVLNRLHRVPWWPVWAAAAWVSMEYAASMFPLGGFAWNRLAWVTVDTPLSGYLGYIGATGTSFVVAFAAQCVAWLTVRLVSAVSPRRIVAAALTAAVLGGLVAGGFGLQLLAARTLHDTATGEAVNVGMVQGDVNGTAGAHAMGYARSVTENHVSETVTLMAKARTDVDPIPELVVWPENSTDVDPTLDPQTAEMVAIATRITQVPLLVGAVMRGPGAGERQTSALWWQLDGTVSGRYDKRNLVPFGEWIPWRNVLLPRLPVLEQIGRQSIPGTTPGVVHGKLNDGREIAVGDIICFELAYDSTVHDVVTHGAQLVVVQSNNATYTATAQPRQQFAITRARAMELQREIAVATTSSLSGLIRPDGTVLDKTQEATSASHTWTMPLREGVSLGVRVGDWWQYTCVVLCTAALLASFRRTAAARPDLFADEAGRID